MTTIRRVRGGGSSGGRGRGLDAVEPHPIADSHNFFGESSSSPSAAILGEAMISLSEKLRLQELADREQQQQQHQQRRGGMLDVDHTGKKKRSMVMGVSTLPSSSLTAAAAGAGAAGDSSNSVLSDGWSWASSDFAGSRMNAYTTSKNLNRRQQQPSTTFATQMNTTNNNNKVLNALKQCKKGRNNYDNDMEDGKGHHRLNIIANQQHQQQHPFFVNKVKVFSLILLTITGVIQLLRGRDRHSVDKYGYPISPPTRAAGDIVSSLSSSSTQLSAQQEHDNELSSSSSSSMMVKEQTEISLSMNGQPRLRGNEDTKTSLSSNNNDDYVSNNSGGSLQHNTTTMTNYNDNNDYVEINNDVDDDDDDDDDDNYLSHLTNMTHPYNSNIETPYFWDIHFAGESIAEHIFTHCHHLILACEFGLRQVEYNDEVLELFTLDNTTYVNVDLTTQSGIHRASQLGLANSQLMDIIISPYFTDITSSVFSRQHPGRMFALFRHPVDRAISMHHYLAKATWDPNYNPALSTMSIEEYAKSRYIENNWMTRFLVNKPSGKLHPADMIYAKTILKAKCLVGLYEDMEVSMARFVHYFGWDNDNDEDARRDQTVKECQYEAISRGDRHVSGSGKVKKKEEVSLSLTTEEEVIVRPNSLAWNAIVRMNMYDMELYEFVKRIYKQQAEEIFDVVGYELPPPPSNHHNTASMISNSIVNGEDDVKVLKSKSMNDEIMDDDKNVDAFQPGIANNEEDSNESKKINH